MVLSIASKLMSTVGNAVLKRDVSKISFVCLNCRYTITQDERECLNSKGRSNDRQIAILVCFTAESRLLLKKGFSSWLLFLMKVIIHVTLTLSLRLIEQGN